MAQGINQNNYNNNNNKKKAHIDDIMKPSPCPSRNSPIRQENGSNVSA